MTPVHSNRPTRLCPALSPPGCTAGERLTECGFWVIRPPHHACDTSRRPLAADQHGHVPVHRYRGQHAAMQQALAHHDAILRDAIEANDGHLVKTTGDGAHAAFTSAANAIAACLAAQRT